MNHVRVMRDEVTPAGQHWLEVMQLGKPVEPGPWVERAPVEAEHLVRIRRRVEKGLDAHWLYVWWPAREVIVLDTVPAKQLGFDGCTEVVLWYLEKGQSLREAADAAAWTGFCRWGRWPTRALVRSIPQGAGESFCLMGEPSVELRLEAAPVLPKGYLLLV